MSRRPAKFTQAEIGRAIRAAMDAGAAAVLLQPDGTIRIELKPGDYRSEPNPWDEDDHEVIL